jgi:hypothetical protein
MVFYIYTIAGKRLGTVFAKDWVDARSEATKKFGYMFSEIFACTAPLPEEGGLVIW